MASMLAAITIIYTQIRLYSLRIYVATNRDVFQWGICNSDVYQRCCSLFAA
jgi:hypothetical protein